MQSELAAQIAAILLDVGAVGFRLDPPVTFKSGIKSPVYVDNRSLPFYPQQWRVILDGFQQVIRDQTIEFDVIAGIEAAGIPHSAALGYVMQQPSIFVRKQAKEHGRQKRVEGGDITDQRVLLVEDLVTTGGSSLSGVEALRESGGIVTDCLAIISYGFAEAVENFEKADIRLHTLTNFEAIWSIARHRVDATIAAEVEAWRRNPKQWRQV